MTTIKSIVAREILDSRGQPTLEVELQTENGSFRAAVPSGASTGAYEAVELRDGDKTRFGGKGVLKAVENVNKVIAPKLLGMDVTKQEEIDKFMVEKIDGSTNEWGWPKAKMGANAILGVSMAVCRAGAAVFKLPLYKYIAQLAGKPTDRMFLPVPCFNVINGGVHAGNLLALQEFMIVPVGAKTFKEAVQMGAETSQTLKSIIKEKFGVTATNVGDEGGVAPGLHMPEEALELLTAAITAVGYQGKVKIGIDAAASECYDAKTDTYNLDFKSKNPNKDYIKTRKQMLDMYKSWIDKYPIVFYEDPFAEDDWEAFAEITQQCGDKVQIIGDDLLVTNMMRMQKAIEHKAANGLLLKLNQIGTVTEAIHACLLAHKNGWIVMTSHRSGETEDTFLADLSVGLGNKQLKSGALCRGERTCKYNQLMRIEEELGDKGSYPGDIFTKSK